MTISRVRAIIKTQGDACANKHLPVVKPRRLPQHKTYRVERLALKNREPSVAADGSLLFIVLLIVQIKHERHNAANGTDGSENGQKCRSYMYRLPGIDFP